MITLLYLKLNATLKDSEVIIPSLENAVHKARLAHQFVFSPQNNDQEKYRIYTEDYKIYFECESLFKNSDENFDCPPFFELHIDKGNGVNHVYGGIKNSFKLQEKDQEIEKILEKMKEYI